MLKRLMLVLTLTAFASTSWAAQLGEDGLHKEDWFSVTFRDIGEDIAAAAANGKRLALIFEQRGCIYCKLVHEELLTDPQVRDYIKANFEIIQFNLYGSEEVTDLDGKKLTEKSAARKWGVVFTPTILFMPEKPVAEKDVRQAAVAAIPGAFRKGTFLDMFHWVREKRYETEEDFPRYHARQVRERQAAGIPNTD
jgi:thioredoxin-related protein